MPPATTNTLKPQSTVPAPVPCPEWFAEAPRHDEPAAADAWPEWYQTLRADAWHNFLETPAPARTDENWRFANLGLIQLKNLAVAAPAADPERIAARSAERGLKTVAARFVFANNRLVHADTGGLPDGLTCLPIGEAIATRGDLVRSHFMREQARLGGGKFAALHGSATLSGVFIHAAKGVVLDRPIEISHWAEGEGTTVFPHTLVIAEAGASLSVVERFRSLNPGDATLSVGVVDLAAEDAGAIQYTAIQNWNDHSRHVQLNGTRVGRDGRAKSCFVNLGGRWVRNESVSRLTAPGADSRMLSANLADGDQEFDQRTLQLHEAGHTTSDLLYKNALYDRARTIFSGLIQVCPGAHHTDAYQSCRNILGSDEAEANSMPGLEIDADQVKCSHGSTSSPIDDEEIFYFLARGIPPKKAREMIGQGFLNGAIEHLDGEELHEAIAERFEERFAVLA
ncbi:MAG: Fe-S cluster assembly protein SufD [Akkermansiaceae bacterium]|nr:Fe-S cluster assembly protein SufD [Akkermansiaceae bacterium]MCP5551241.1 Fe-S cluster assembly protein SufD [Akkermansiaceae bacterium]